MTDVYRRTGRGGAGNFYSQKDVDEVNKTENESQDLEAQKQSTSSDSQPRPHPHPLRSSPILYTQRPDIPARSSSGRGGAGNFTTSASPSTSTPTNPTTTTTTASSSPTAMAAGTLSGRGGAGNWASSSQQPQPYDAEQERRRQEALRGEEGEGGRLGLAREVRESLLPRLPPKIHYLHGPGRGRKPDVTA
ncbi:hypothetical protein F4809DRAFT_620201 [Biscogniauxia mediterranea]|nr:hypothetical protein F4809DRAFT_620201 [Biscogniauxia mediterranea]